MEKAAVRSRNVTPVAKELQNPEDYRIEKISYRALTSSTVMRHAVHCSFCQGIALTVFPSWDAAMSRVQGVVFVQFGIYILLAVPRLSPATAVSAVICILPSGRRPALWG